MRSEEVASDITDIQRCESEEDKSILEIALSNLCAGCDPIHFEVDFVELGIGSEPKDEVHQTRGKLGRGNLSTIECTGFD